MFCKGFANPQIIIINKSTKLSHLPQENQQQITLLINMIQLMQTKFLLDISVRLDKAKPHLCSFIFLNSAHGMEDDKIDEQNQMAIRLLLKFNATLTKEKDYRPLWSNSIATVHHSDLNAIHKQLSLMPALDPDHQQPRMYLRRHLAN